jgi:small subunit ribosomal protein S2
MVASLDVAATVPARPLATIEPNQSQATIMKMLLEAGVHFGHQTKRWNPKMRPYIFTERNGIHIIDLAQTVSGLEAATAFVEELAAQGGRMLFVGTKKQAQDVISEESNRCGQFYVNRRWPGGLLTNFVTIKTRLTHLADLEAQKARGEFEMRTKKEASKLNEEIRKLTEVLGGIKSMQALPSAMFVVDPHKERIAMLEALRLEIPVLAIGDTNANPDEIDYVIPGNDDAIRSIKIITARLADAFIEGVNRREATRAEQMMSDEEQGGRRDRGGRGGSRDGGDRNRDRGGRGGSRDGGDRRSDNAPQASTGEGSNQAGGERRDRRDRPQGERRERPQGDNTATATQTGERPQGEQRRERPQGERRERPQGGDQAGANTQQRPQGERRERPQGQANTGEQSAPSGSGEQAGGTAERPRRERSTAPRSSNAPAPRPTESASES